MSDNITLKNSNQELLLTESQVSTLIEQLTEGITLTEIFTKQKLLPISLTKFYALLKKNPELEKVVMEARKNGIQTLIDKLLMVYETDIQSNRLDNNVIMWTRDKANFVKFLASKLSDLYSDNKPSQSNIRQQITVSWLDDPSLEKKFIDMEAEEAKIVEQKQLDNQS